MLNFVSFQEYPAWLQSNMQMSKNYTKLEKVCNAAWQQEQYILQSGLKYYANIVTSHFGTTWNTFCTKAKNRKKKIQNSRREYF